MYMSTLKNLPLLHNPKEFTIRSIAILVIGILFPLVFHFEDFFTPDHYKAIIISVFRTALLWYGSMYIVNFVIARIDFFKETAKTISIQTAALLVYTALVISLEFYTIGKFTHFRYTTSERMDMYIIACLITLFITTLYASSYFFIQWKENYNKAEKFEKANLEAQYETLKNQINPHFLFNSLNTLTGMLDDNSEPSKYVQNLSDFFRYVLQTRDKEVVLLRDEIQITEKYAFLQQKRFANKLFIDISIPENTYHYAIPPLALQMLIENAIKHNIISKEKPLFVKVSILHNHSLVVENNLQKKQVETSTGIGLNNIRNRYKFLGASHIEVEENENTFKVTLPLLKVSF